MSKIQFDPNMPSCYFIQQFLCGTYGHKEYLLDEVELRKVRAVFKAFSDMVYGTRFLDISKSNS